MDDIPEMPKRSTKNSRTKGAFLRSTLKAERKYSKTPLMRFADNCDLLQCYSIEKDTPRSEFTRGFTFGPPHLCYVTKWRHLIGLICSSIRTI